MKKTKKDIPQNHTSTDVHRTIDIYELIAETEQLIKQLKTNVSRLARIATGHSDESSIEVSKNYSENTFLAANHEKSVVKTHHTDLKFEIVVTNVFYSVRAKVLSITPSGAILDHSLTVKHNATPFEATVIISSRDRTVPKIFLRFKAIVVGGPDYSSRISFISDEKDALIKLKEILVRKKSA